jgi:tryptophan-rich sensory protein
MNMLFPRDENSTNRPLLVFVLLSLLVGGTASFFTEPSIPTWYAALAKPAFSPPNWVFAPVWTALYVLMGVAAARVWNVIHHRPASPFARSATKGEVAVAGSQASEGRRGFEIEMWIAQLVLNFFWSAIFFAAHLILPALIEMATLWIAILVTLVLFWRRDRVAGLLFVPYLAWVSFAFALNAAIWQLNS